MVQRRFNPDTPDQLWCGQHHLHIATDEGWVYLAAVIDLFSRQVVGWSMQAHKLLIRQALFVNLARAEVSKPLDGLKLNGIGTLQ